ncbi:hypothetical protein Syn6312_0993 [Synechococcus sp. PCC 6312]|nr:hypothetical protein Syn6312_0993 [Synechococcus sp. PCC 6312]
MESYRNITYPDSDSAMQPQAWARLSNTQGKMYHSILASSSSAFYIFEPIISINPMSSCEVNRGRVDR